MFELATFAVLIGVGYFVGSHRESEHLKDLYQREKKFTSIQIRSGKQIAGKVNDAQMVMASVVVANDYFKMAMTSLISIIGGQIRSQETLLERARREATLRLLDKAQIWGAHEVAGFRMETSMIDGSGVEVFVYGTAIKRG